MNNYWQFLYLIERFVGNLYKELPCRWTGVVIRC